MFILDKEIKGGYLSGTGRGTNYEEFNGNFTFKKNRTSSDYDPPIGGGSFLARVNTIHFNIGTAEGATISWNRMSDGTLVAVGNAGLQISGGVIHRRINANSVNYDTVGTKDGDDIDMGAYIWYWGQTVTLMGAQYRVRIMRVGSTTDLQNKSDVNKYIVACPDASWANGEYDRFTDTFGTSVGEHVRYGWWKPDHNRFEISTSYGSLDDYREDIYVRLMAVPTGDVPTFKNDDIDLGILTKATTINLPCAHNATYTVYIDDEQFTATEGTECVIDLSTKWDELTLTAHTIKVISQANGYKCGAIVRFTKSESTVKVTGHVCDMPTMPTMCKLIDSCVVPSGATITREVCNNGNDGTPTWEVYTSSPHTFSNTIKTVQNWGINWRITIDNQHGNSQARIDTGVTIGVVRQN